MVPMTRRLFALSLALLIGLLPLLPATAWAEEPLSLSGATVTLESGPFIYDGTEKTPKVTVTLDGTTLTENLNYEVTYRNNIDAGVAMVLITGTGAYTGSVETGFTIDRRPVRAAMKEWDSCPKPYDGTTDASPDLIVVDAKSQTPVSAASVRYAKAVYDAGPYAGLSSITVTGLELTKGAENYVLEKTTVTLADQQITPCEMSLTPTATLATGYTLDLTTLVTGADKDQLTFQINGSDCGCKLDGPILTSGDMIGTVEIQVKALESDLNGDKYPEYLPGSDTLTITLQEKEPQGGGTTGGSTTGGGGSTGGGSTGTTPDASQGAFALVCDRKSLTYGETLALRTTGGSGSGSVRYTVDTRLGGGATVDQDGVLTATKVGEVVVSATKDGDDRYQAATSQAVILSIQPATITIQVGDRTAQVGDTAPAAADLGYTVKGLVGRDTLAKAPTLSYVAKPNMGRAGTATVRASGAKVPDGGNYVPTITYRDGTLTIRAAVLYPITVEKPTNGTLTVDRTTAAEGDSVTVTAMPGKGYVLDRLTVETDRGGTVRTTQKGGDRYGFTMPARAVTVSAVFRAAEQLPFTDVRTGDWWYGNVLYVYEKGLMTGTSQTTFSPQATTTRGMIVTILHRLAGSPGAGGAPFTDVAAGQYYAVPIAWAASYGIVNGYDAARFGPNDPITREQMAAILYRYAGRMGYDTTAQGDPSQFRDSGRIHAYAWTPLAWANGRGLINGKGDGVLDPTGQATRAEVAAILQRFCEGFLK